MSYIDQIKDISREYLLTRLPIIYERNYRYTGGFCPLYECNCKEVSFEKDCVICKPHKDHLKNASLLDLKLLLLRSSIKHSNVVEKTGNSLSLQMQFCNAEGLLLKEINKLLSMDPDDLKNSIDMSDELTRVKKENEELKETLLSIRHKLQKRFLVN